MNYLNYVPVFPTAQPPGAHPQPGENERHSFKYIPAQPQQFGYVSYPYPYPQSQPLYHPAPTARPVYPSHYQYPTPISPYPPLQAGPYYQPPAIGAQPAFVYGEKTYEHSWVGRTKAQVDEDNHKTAMRNGVWKPNELAPNKPADDQQFWVVELDGSYTLRNYAQIEELRPGEWRKDPNFGNAYFVRFPKPDEKMD